MVEKVLGVLGGMGPLARAEFMVRLTLLTPAVQDQDHIPTVLWSDPRVPPRTAASWPAAEDPLPALLRGIRGLEAAGCGAVAIPCNTAHGWFDGDAGGDRLPILHIVDAAAAELRPARRGAGPDRRDGHGRRRWRCGSIRNGWRARGWDCLVPTPEEMERLVTPAIALVKANGVAEAYPPLAEVARGAGGARRAGGGAGLHRDPARHRCRAGAALPGHRHDRRAGPGLDRLGSGVAEFGELESG